MLDDTSQAPREIDHDSISHGANFKGNGPRQATVFDPETVQDNSTMQDGGLPSSGIPYVLVNGTVVVRDSENVEDVFPGKPIFGAEKAG